MKSSSRYLRANCAALIAALLCTFVHAQPAIAGTTGTLSGVVSDENRAPIAGVRVTAISPSETVSVTTDSSGRYAFVSLAPDEYTVTAEKNGLAPASVAGIAIFADASQTVPILMHTELKTIATVTSHSAGDLVRAGTTADVYSVNAAQQARTSVLGGGGNLNSAYSAIASIPGAYVPTNQNGYNQAVHVRGGDSSEVGYEFDGIPVNRAFDNYPSGSAASLGQAELQVYTGAAPADAEAQGLAGFINQVIKTGTTPGYLSFDLTAGTPAFYHSLQFEGGGATPDRRFSYYVGIGGYNQEHRYIDQQNGNSYQNEFGQPLDTCAQPLPAGSPPSCYTNGLPNVGAAGTAGYILGPIPFGADAASIQDRTSVFNFHFAIPHKNDGLRDDVQLLYDNDSIQTPLYVSALDEGLINFQGTTYGPGVTPYYTDTYQYTGSPGTFFTDANIAQVQPYLFPSSPTNRPLFAPLPVNARDVQYNNQAIVKLQYQHAFSSDSFLRLYGYTYYSDYIAAGAVSSWQPITGLDSGDYELSSHTRGLSGTFVKQFGGQHLVQAQASYVTATSLRMNSLEVFNNLGFGGLTDNFAVVVNPNDLTSGTCYALAAGTATPSTCGTGNTVPIGAQATFASLGSTFTAGAPTSSSGQDLSQATLAGYTCGTGACALYTVENGASGKYNTVKPVFTGFALTDEWRPSQQLVINAGLRFDQYKYEGGDTAGTAARTFWFSAFNNDTCFNTQNLTLVDKSTLETGAFNSSTPCSSFGTQYSPATLTNVPSQTFTYNLLQPRIGISYTASPDTVLRASFGKYIEQPSAAYEQYDSLQQNLPDQLAQFYSLGFTTPGHEVRPPVSYNADFSYEHHFKGTDMSMKLTPFFRQTHDQIENFYLNIKQGFVSGLNAGEQTSTGFELAFTKGSFDRDGFAAQVGFAYTYADLKFNSLSNGTTILSPINADIANYNAFTKDCAPGGRLAGKAQFGQSLCGALPAGEVAAPCYAAGGVADPACLSTSVANPYWNAPGQALFDPNARYLPYSTIPGGIGTGVNAYTYPYVATLILQYKHKKLAITPSFQYVAGNRYGAPETTPGIDPAAATCTALAAGAVSGDQRYPYGSTGGAPYDATTCPSALVIPDPYTGQFDGLGAFREPAQLLGHLRISYDFSPRVSANVTFANVINTCFGGQQTAFTYYSNRYVCSYGPVGAGLISPVGNAYNPGDNVQTLLRYPYEPVFGTYNDLTSSTLNPFSVYFNVKIRI